MGRVFSLNDGKLLLSTEAPGGIYSSVQLKMLAELGESAGVVIRATEDQRLALLVNEDDAKKISDKVRAAGLGVRHYQDGLHQPISCIGKHCPDHDQDALQAVFDITKMMENLKISERVKVGINGCAQCCVPTHTLDISILGDSSGYRISLGGKNSQIPEMASFIAEGVPAKDLPGLICNVLEIFQNQAAEGESLQNVIDRCGLQEFINVLAPYSQDAAGADHLTFGDTDAQLPAEDGVGDDLSESSIPIDGNGDDEISETSGTELEIDVAGGSETPDIEYANIVPNVTSSSEDTDEFVMDDLSDADIADGSASSLDQMSEIDSDDLRIGDGALSSDFELPEADDLEVDILEPVEADFDVEEQRRMANEPQPETKEEMPSLIDDLEDAPVLADDEENEFENQINSDIEEEKKIISSELFSNAKERDSAIKLTEDVGEDFSESVEQSKHQIEELAEAELDLEQLAEDLVSEGIIEGEASDTTGIPEQRSRRRPQTGIPLGEGRDEQAKGPLSSSNQLESVEFLENGEMAVSFSSGVSLSFDVQQLVKAGGSKKLTINGQEIQVRSEQGGIQIKVDGVAIRMPQSKLAA